MRYGITGQVYGTDVGLRGRRPRHRRGRPGDRRGRLRRGRDRRLGGRPARAGHRGLRRHGRAVELRHLAPLRRPPRRVRHGRGRRRAGPRGGRGGRRARRHRARRARSATAPTSDAFHLTAPMQDGAGAAQAIRRALEDAGIGPEDVDYVNAHGTSTPLNDRSETRALKTALGDRAAEVPVSSIKSVIGHLLGAAGAVEAVATVLALAERVAPPTWAGRSARRAGPRLRPRRPAASERQREAARRHLQLVRVRRPQRRARPGGSRCLTGRRRPRTGQRSGRWSAWRRSATRARCTSSAPRSSRRRMGDRARAGDGVIGAAGARQRPARLRLRAGHLATSAARSAPQHAETIVRVLRARRTGARAGRRLRRLRRARACRRASTALAGYGRIFGEHVRLSGRVPQISVIAGT